MQHFQFESFKINESNEQTNLFLIVHRCRNLIQKLVFLFF